VAIVATGERFPDALAASGLAGIVDAPILLTRINTLSPTCDYALRVLGVEKVYILGDTRAVSAGIETEFRKRYWVQRLGGPDRYYTARDIADEAIRLGGSTTEAFLAQGVNFPDALAVSSIATQEHITVLLTRPGELHSEAAAVIAGADIEKVYVAGDTKAISALAAAQVTQLGASVIRWAGPNRYETAAAIVNGALGTWGIKVTKIGIATGANWPDALTGGAAMGRQDGLLLLSRPDVLSPYIESLIVSHKATIREVEFYGSTKSLSQTVENRVRYLLQ
jgi:putative cell wall-binding protein